LDMNGKFVRSDHLSRVVLYISFETEDGVRRELRSHSSYLGNFYGGDATQIDELMNRNADLRPENPFFRYNRFIETVAFAIDPLLREKDLSEDDQQRLLAQKYAYLNM